MSVINVGIAGATGYTGEELVSILSHHPQVRIAQLCSTTAEPVRYSSLLPKFKNKVDLMCVKIDHKNLGEGCELVFLALPHTVSMDFVPGLLKKGKKVIDLGADYRLKDSKVYEHNYNVAHKDTANLKAAVYGLPELHRARIKTSKLVANPGCYPTASLLALAPLLSLGLVDAGSIIIDAKSGVSGAGKKVVSELSFSEVNEDFKAYKVNAHQHTPEIAQELTKLAGEKIHLVFVPHLLPLYRGILATIYCKPKGAAKNTADILKLYRKFYKNEPFIRLKDEGTFPRLKDVAGTNFCDIGIKSESGSMIVISAIDNLIKGAAGQAVQNMNIMYGFPEKTAL